MRTKDLYVYEAGSAQCKEAPLIISLLSASANPRTGEFLLGRIGYPSLKRQLSVGDATLVEAVSDGVFEVRIMAIHYRKHEECWAASVLATRLDGTGGPLAGVDYRHSGNHPFTTPEVARIRQSLQSVAEAVAQRSDIKKEQAEYIVERLDELIDATNRLGRRDWVNLAVGTLTNAVISVAMGTEPARFIFQRLGQSLEWLLGQAVRFLS